MAAVVQDNIHIQCIRKVIISNPGAWLQTLHTTRCFLRVALAKISPYRGSGYHVVGERGNYYFAGGTAGLTSILLGKVRGFICSRSATIWPMSSGCIFQASASLGT